MLNSNTRNGARHVTGAGSIGTPAPRARVRSLYLGVAALALVAAGGTFAPAAMAQAIIDTTPTNLNVTDIGTILNNRPRSADNGGADIVTLASDSAGVDVQVKLQLGETVPFFGWWVDIGSPFDSVGDIDVNVGNVEALFPDQMGINATNAAGHINIVAGDVHSDGTGVNAEVRGFSVTIPLLGTYSLPATGNIDINVGNVTSDGGDGINATTGFGTVNVVAGDVTAENGLGVNATTQFALGLGDVTGLITGGAGSFDPAALLAGNGVSVSVGTGDPDTPAVHSKDTAINAEVLGAQDVLGSGYDVPGIGSVAVIANGDVISDEGNGINAATGLGLVNVAAGNVTARNGFGVNVTTGLGLVTVNVGDVEADEQGINATITGFEVPGLVDLDGIGVVYVNAGDVSSQSAGGVNATVDLGASIVTVGDVESFGTGVNAQAGTGIAFALANDVTTEDTDAHGMNVTADGIAVAISTGHVSTGGDGAYGVNVEAGSADLSALDPFVQDIDDAIAGLGLPVTAAEIIDVVEGGIAFAGVNNVSTTGDGAVGVNASAPDGIAGVVAAGLVSTTGDNANGIQADGDAFAAVIANDVSATGPGSQGIIADATSGSALVLADTVTSDGAGITATGGDGFVGVGVAEVTTTGDNAGGVHASVDTGDVYVAAGTVNTQGDNSTGIHGETSDGSTYILAGDVTTQGDDSAGIVNIANGTSVTIFGNVVTSGTNSPGVVGTDPLSDVIVAGISVVTQGADSAGILADSDIGNVTVVVGEVTTEQDDSLGIEAITNAGDVFVGTGSVMTAGALSDAILAYSRDSDATIVAGIVSTAGFGSDGITAEAGDDATIVVETVTTGGDFAHGILADAGDDATIIVDEVSTGGAFSDAITAFAGDDATVIAGTVNTTGFGSDGITAQAGDDATIVLETVTTGGDFAHGILADAGDDATVIADDVTTGGDFSDAIAAFAGDDATIVAGTVSTAGFGSDGITAQTGDDATVVVETVTTGGDFAHGILADAGDDATIIVDEVSTGGAFSDAITAFAGDDATVIAGIVNTTGFGSDGITAEAGDDATIVVETVTTGGDFAHGILADAGDDATIIVDEVSTAGDFSDGVQAYAGDDATIVAGTVNTAGFGSDGISAWADGNATVFAGTVSTQGDFATGIYAFGYDGAFVAADTVTTQGEESHGIVAGAVEGPVLVTALGPVRATGENAQGISAFSEDGLTVVFVLDEVYGGSGTDGAGVNFGGGDGAWLINAGSIGSANDRAIVNNDFDSVVSNFGGVTGFVQMGAGADTFYNHEGARFIARGDSDFGGDQDEFHNSGLVTMADRLVPTTVTIAGLETFENSDDGVISLINDIEGDILDLPDSNFEGGGLLAIDADLQPGGTADQLHIGNNVTGVTSLFVNDLDAGIPGQYDPDGVLFAMVNGTSDATNFTTNGGIDKGLFRYDAYLRQDTNTVSGENEWYLASAFDREAYEFPIIASGAQNLWHASTGTWLDRTADLRSAFGEAPSEIVNLKNEGAVLTDTGNVTPGAWLKLFGGTQERDMSNVAAPPSGMTGPSHTYDDVFKQRHYGFMVGIDGGRESRTEKNENGALLAGVMAGYTGSSLDFDKSSTDVDYKMGSVGAYVTYLNGGFFADAALKADFGRIDYRSDLGGGQTGDFKGDFTSVGVIVDTGYRINDASGWFVEPKATLAYVHTNYDDAEISGSTVSLDSAESVRGRLGARVGTQINQGGSIIEPWLEGSVWHEFKGDYTAVFASNGYNAPVSYDLGGTFGEVAGGLSFINIGNGWSGYSKGAVQFGSDNYLGFTGNLGVRKSW